MSRVVLARVVSIVGHPAVLMLVAALSVATAHGASVGQLRFIAGALAILAAVVLGYSWYQVRAGRWTHVDASAKGERTSLNLFLAVILFAGAVVVWYLTRRPYMPVALALSGALIATAMLIARWVKMSLHVAFAAFATVLLWPLKIAVVVGLLVTTALVWSRLILGRHVMADAVAGLLLGAAAGGGYQWWAT